MTKEIVYSTPPLVWTSVEKDSALTPIEVGIYITTPNTVLGLAAYPLLTKKYDELIFESEVLDLYEKSYLLPILKQGGGYERDLVDEELMEMVSRYDRGLGLRYAGRGENWKEFDILFPKTGALITAPPLDLNNFSEMISLALLADEIEPRLKTPPAGRAAENAQLDYLEFEYYLKILHAVPLNDA